MRAARPDDRAFSTTSAKTGRTRRGPASTTCKPEGTRFFRFWGATAELGLRMKKCPSLISLRKGKLREAIRREGRYLLHSNLSAGDPDRLWRLYMLLVEVEQVFKNLKGDLAVRPIHHQSEQRVEAHIFIAYCLHATLRYKLSLKAPGLTPRSLIEQLRAIQMLDVHFPTTDGRTLVFSRYTTPDKAQKLLIDQLGLKLPPQSPPRITAGHQLESSSAEPLK